MKSAFDMVKEVEAHEAKKRVAKSVYKTMLENARRGQLELTWWERHVTMRNFKKQLQKECRPMLHEGKYYVHPFLCGVHRDKWDQRWINYGAYLLEQLGYIQVETHLGIVGEPYIRAILPQSLAEQILFSSKGS